MSQTLLTVAAILVFSLFALNQHRAQARSERNAMGSEVEFAVAELARAELLKATALPFDETLLGITRLLVDPNTLTLPSAFGPGRDPGETQASPADDVDDLHGVVRTVTVQRDNQSGRTMPLSLRFGVRYVLVNEPGTAAGANQRTLAKEVSVAVVEVVTGPVDRPPVTVMLTQVVTPAWQMVHG